MYGRGKPSQDFLLQAASTTGAGETKQLWFPSYTWQARGIVGSGTGSATIVIQVTNVKNPVDADWITMGTITLTLGTASTTDGFASNAPWVSSRANITSLTGSSPSIDVWVGGAGR